MYLESITYKGDNWYYPPGYSMTETELIEEEGEAVEAWLSEIAAGEFTYKFNVEDDYSDEDIELDIKNYLSDDELQLLSDTYDIGCERGLSEAALYTALWNVIQDELVSSD